MLTLDYGIFFISNDSMGKKPLEEQQCDKLKRTEPNFAVIFISLFSLSLRPLLFRTRGEESKSAHILKQEFVCSILTIPNLTELMPRVLLPAFSSSLTVLASIKPPQTGNINNNNSIYVSTNKPTLEITPSADQWIHSLSLPSKTLITENILNFLPIMLEKDKSALDQIVPLLHRISEAVFTSESTSDGMALALSNLGLIEEVFGRMLSDTGGDLADEPAMLLDMYGQAFTHWTWKHYFPVINTICAKTKAIPLVWATATRAKAFASIPENIQMASWSLDKLDRKISILLNLFCRLFHHVLLSIEETEFYNQQEPIKHENLANIVAFLKDLAVKGYTSPPKIPQQERLLTNISTLLRTLYTKNCKNVFCQAKNWLFTAYPLTLLPSDRMRQVLEKVPFVVNFQERVQIFYDALSLDKKIYQPNPFDTVKVQIRRSHILEDGIKTLGSLTAPSLKKIIRVEFLTSSMIPESGIDGGGLFKEFFEILMKTAYNPEYGLFIETPSHKLYPNPYATNYIPQALHQFDFLGKILGKAIYEGILVELPFPYFFLSKFIGEPNTVNDLVYYDADLYKQLNELKNYPADLIQDLDLTFSVVDDVMGKKKVVDLIPNGHKIDVTKDNLYKYIAYVAHFRMNSQIRNASNAFQEGLHSIIRPELLKMFNQHELRTIIGGYEGGIDLEDLKANTLYGNGYYPSHPLVGLFWDVLGELDYEEQRKFLFFATSASRAPLLGFSKLEPKFCIHRSRKDEPNPDSFLPSASTCMNLLKLPYYSSKQILKERLLYAINSNSGFELS